MLNELLAAQVANLSSDTDDVTERFLREKETGNEVLFTFKHILMLIPVI